MMQEEVNRLLAEIVVSKSFINIDNNDIYNFKKGVDIIDGIKVSGRGGDVGELISESISTLTESNRGRVIRKLLFAIRLPIDNSFMMNHMSKVYKTLDMLGEDLECVWGISTSNKLVGEKVELIVFVGFTHS